MELTKKLAREQTAVLLRQWANALDMPMMRECRDIFMMWGVIPS